MKISTLITLLLLVVIASLSVVGVRQGWFVRSKPADETASARSLFDPALVADDVTEVEIAPADKPVSRLSKIDGKWQFSQPVRGLAQEYRVQGIISDLTGLRVLEEYAAGSANAPDPVQTQLEQPEGTIRLTANDKTRTVRIGSQRPLTDQTYVQVEGDPAIYLVRGQPGKHLQIPLDDLREKAVASLSVDRVVGLQFAGQANYALELRDKQWMVQKPVSAVADNQKVSDLLNKITGLQATGFATENLGDLGAFGFDKPYLQATIRHTSQSDTTTAATQSTVEEMRLTFGRRLGRSFGRINEEPWLFRLEDNALDALVAKLEDLRDRRVLPLAERAIQAIEVAGEGKSIQLTQADGKWSITAPRQGPASQSAVKMLADNLTSLRTQDFVDEYDSLERFGLETPKSSYNVTLSDGSTYSLLVGGDSPAGVARFVKLAGPGHPTVMTVSNSALAALPNSLESFWSTELLALPTEEIAAIIVSGPDINYKLRQPSRNRFVLAEPVQAAADDENVSVLTRQLAKLDAEKILSVSDSIPDIYAAGSPVRMIVQMGQPRPLATEPAPTQPATEPAAEVEITRTLELMVNRVDGQYVAWVASSQPAVVAQVPQSLYDALRAEMRDRQVWDISIGPLQTITLKQPSATISLVREDDEQPWTYPADAYFKVDQNAVTEFVNSLRGAKAERFVGQADEPAEKYGLDKPEIVLSVTQPIGPAELRVSAKGPEGQSGRYGSSTRASGYFVLPADVVAKLRRELASFAQKDSTGNP